MSQTDVQPEVTHTMSEKRTNAYIVPEDYTPRLLSHPSLKKTSKKLCYVLRWAARKFGLTMTEDGYVDVDDILRCDFFHDISTDTLREICETDDKQRFQMLVNDETNRMRIRATNGHGIPGIRVVERKLTNADSVGLVVHVTDWFAMRKIRKEGLRRRKRNHIHFVARQPGPREVVAGTKSGADFCVFVDATQAIKDGIPFWLTHNGVVVSEGDEEGRIPLRYVVKIIGRKNLRQYHPQVKPLSVRSNLPDVVTAAGH